MTERCIANECLSSTGFSYTLSLINGKYKMTILYTLMEFGVVRFNEMKKYIGEISYKTLSLSLIHISTLSPFRVPVSLQYHPHSYSRQKAHDRDFSNVSVPSDDYNR